MVNSLGSSYQMFTTMILSPPLLQYFELSFVLHSYEARVLTNQISSSSSHVPFAATKSINTKLSDKKFSFEKRGILSFANIVSKSSSIALASSHSTKHPIQPIWNEEELKTALKFFHSVCLICHKLGHNSHKCFKHLNKEFKTPSIQPKLKIVQQALIILQTNSIDASQ